MVAGIMDVQVHVYIFLVTLRSKIYKSGISMLRKHSLPQQLKGIEGTRA